VNLNKSYSKYEQKVLNFEQKNVYDQILKNEINRFLIHGVTGSGKTEIYMQLVSYMININRDSIILVPEISLTPQMIERFKGRFGKDVAIFHSRLSVGEKFDEWLKVKEGKVKVAIGARSAIFLPFKNLGLIVIDEEHEASYKSESNPKYDARDIAVFKSKISNCKVVLGSATPAIDTYYKTEKNEIMLLNLSNRAVSFDMPEINVVDMREELLAGNKSMFSRDLFIKMKQSIMDGDQILLFLNRRGFSSFVSCRKCGYVFKCKNCDVSLTYHASKNIMQCHYCGSVSNVPKVCSKCGSKYVKYFGVGTEQVEREVKKYFSSTTTLRMDFDTTRQKNSYERIYDEFKHGKAQVLIGTQMIAKGLDFPNVTLVGVLAADLTLNMPDYKSQERTYQLLTQVSGRAGRGQKKGRVVIQTYSPDNYSIECSVKNDYKNFYKKELELREVMDYPPFSKLFNANFSSKNESLLIKKVNEIGDLIKFYTRDKELTVLGPCPCGISKIKEMYRWQIIVKGNFNEDCAIDIKNMIYKFLDNVYEDIKVSIDINPNNIL
jgi:primosomal protein N' (replication factor Y)